MGAYNLPPDIARLFREMNGRIKALETTQRTPRYDTASRPDPTTVGGLIIYVTDGAAGSRFQGSNGTAWVSLG